MDLHPIEWLLPLRRCVRERKFPTPVEVRLARIVAYVGAPLVASVFHILDHAQEGGVSFAVATHECMTGHLLAAALLCWLVPASWVAAVVQYVHHVASFRMWSRQALAHRVHTRFVVAFQPLCAQTAGVAFVVGRAAWFVCEHGFALQWLGAPPFGSLAWLFTPGLLGIPLGLRVRSVAQWAGPQWYCHQCGYPRWGLPGPRCPECGEEFSEELFRELVAQAAVAAQSQAETAGEEKS